jgi:ribokinase
MRVAVVGHVEWIEFVRVPRMPAAGDIVHARESWHEPGGGGAVAAVQLLKLAGACTFFTALGDDELGHRARHELTHMGLRVEALHRGAQRRAFTHIDDSGERTITVLGERLTPLAADALPWPELGEYDAVYVTACDHPALQLARRARILVATARISQLLRQASVPLDALVGSARDPAEQYTDGDIEPPPRLVVRTDGGRGGTHQSPGGELLTYPPTPLPGPVVDAYGCGDAFAAGLTFGLAAGHPAGHPAAGAVHLAARCGAAALTGRGPYTGQLTRADL